MQLPDLNHLWGNDLSFNNEGDIQQVNGPYITQQRLYRRLMTNLGEYIWNLDYGAGFPEFIGQTLHEDTIRAIAREQVDLESSVAKIPPATISVSSDFNTIFLKIEYTDENTNEQHTINYGFGG